MNEIPATRVVRGRLCGIFPKPRWCNDSFKVLVAGAILFTSAVCIALVVDISLRNHKKFVEVVTDDPQCTELVSSFVFFLEDNFLEFADFFEGEVKQILTKT